jgi:hypothetical protein
MHREAAQDADFRRALYDKCAVCLAADTKDAAVGRLIIANLELGR